MIINWGALIAPFFISDIKKLFTKLFTQLSTEKHIKLWIKMKFLGHAQGNLN